MRQFPNNDPQEDKDLVQFLNRYRPIPPMASHNLEDRVMALVHQNPRSSSGDRRLWVIPSAIAVGLCLAWVGSRRLEPTPNFASREAQSQELAAFMVDNWQNVADNSANFATDPASSSGWQSLTYSEMISSASN